MHTSEGSLTQFTEGPHQRAWTVHWDKADVSYTKGIEPGGDMANITGTLYKDDSEASRFSAGKGHAEKGTGVLELSDAVTVNSLDLGTTLHCSQVVWDAKNKLLKATGGVSLEDKGYTLSGISELWCSADLKQFSTPDLYSKP